MGLAERILRRMDLNDALHKRPALGKAEYKARVQRLLKTKKAQAVAANFAQSLRKVCRTIVKKGGAASGY